MNYKKAMISGIFVIIVLLLLIWERVRVDLDETIFLSGIRTAENQVREGNEKIEKQTEYDMFEGVNQCIWGTWVITEVWLQLP